MTVPQQCPDAESLVGLLDSRLPQPQQQNVTEHVSSCDTCLQRLDSLVTHGLRKDLDFEHVGDYLRQGAKANTLSEDARQQLTAALCGQTTAFHQTIAELSLDFLKPSDDESSLGRLGQYEITEVIGRGGMGVALKGRDTRLDRVVAIKVLAPELASNPTARKRFLRESQAAAAVSHEHVVTTFAVEPGKLPYLAMEYIDGQSLQQKIDRQGALELKEILRIGMQTAYGLAAAHAQGLIHRDIKPSNILLQNSVERVQITDFGLARAVDDVAITRTGEVTGTPQYMSPEQAQGLPVDCRSDLFSLGSVLYAMCTGRSPFRAESAIGVINRVCNDAPRPIEEINSDIPAWMTAIIDRLLQKEPADRFQTADEVADLLSQCLTHVQQPVVVPLPEVLPATSRIKPHLSRRPKWHIGVVLLAVLMGSLGVTEGTGVTQFSSSVISVVRGDGTLRIEVNDPDVNITIEGDDVVIRGAGPQEVRLKPGEYHVTAERDGQPVPLERELVSITRGDREVVKVTRDNAPTAENVRSPKEPTADYRSIPAEAISEVQRLSARGGFVTSLAFSADGRHIVAGRSSALDYWNLEAAARERFETTSVQAVSLSRDGDLVAAAVGNSVDATTSSIQIRDIATGRLLQQFPAETGSFRAVSLSPDGKRIVAGDGDGIAFIRGVGSGAELGRVNTALDSSGRIDFISFSADGERVLIGGAMDLVVMEVDSGRELLALDGFGQSFAGAIAPDGNSIAVASFTSPDDELHPIQLFDVETGEVRQRFVGHTWIVRGLSFLPDGRHIVSGSSDKTLRIWNVASGEEVARVETDNHVTHNIAVSPDGRFVVSGGGHFRKTPDYRLRPHETLVSDYVRDFDYDIRIWQLPESVWPEAFVVIRTDGTEFHRLSTLAEAVLASSPGDTIEVRGSGTFLTDPIEITQSLRIRAADGYSPTLQLTRAGERECDPIIRVQNSTLVLEGIAFRRLIDPPSGEAKTFTAADGSQHHVSPAFLLSLNSSLHVSNCRFQSNRGLLKSSIRSTGSDSGVDVRNCIFVLPGTLDNATADIGRIRQRTIRNSIVAGGIAVATFVSEVPAEPEDIELTNSTLLLTREVVRHQLQSYLRGFLSRVNASGNVVSAEATLGFARDCQAITKKEEVRQYVHWSGSGDVYQAGRGLISLRFTEVPQYLVQSLDEWRDVWNLPEATFERGDIRFQGGDLPRKLLSAPEEITAEDFRLREDSAGYQAGPDGQDRGANIDFVGPGAAYERWKVTADYKAWCEEVHRLLGGATQPR